MHPVKFKLMTTFKQATDNQYTYTTNGMLAHQQTGSALTNLFYKIGSSRDVDIIPSFVAAFVEDEDKALRIALWARDARQGAGERKTFYSILKYLQVNDVLSLSKLLDKVPELGRWDDVLQTLQPYSLSMIERGLANQDRLCAKWMPRKGPIANLIRKNLKLTPKEYRKLLVSLSETVEQKMCSKNWMNINYSHVPSKAMSIYAKAFQKNDATRFLQYIDDLKTNKTKVNASAIYPYEIIHALRKGTKESQELFLQQWEALPNFVDSMSILPLVDVSGSMDTPNNSKSRVTNMDIAISLGLYLADKNKGAFKDLFLTFSQSPQLLHLKGNLLQKLQQMERSSWGMNTNIIAAMELILKTAVENLVPQSQMPSTLLILSDMQFDGCVHYNATAKDIIQKGFKRNGYTPPNIVFWNLDGSTKNVPARTNDLGVALISGFSPSILQSFLSGEEMTPYSIMMKTIMKDRYNI